MTKPLLVDANGIEQFIGDDGVVHAHASLVEYPHDGFITFELAPKFSAQSFRGRRKLRRCERSNVAGIMDYRFAIQPAAKSLEEVVVLKIRTPKSAVFDSRLGHRCIQIEHPDQPRPLPRPVRDRKDGPTMRHKARKDVMAVLPDGLDYDQGRLRRNLAKDLDAVALAMNKSVLLDGIVGMTSADGASIAANRSRHRLFRLRLCRPARLVSGDAQVATRDKDDFFVLHGLPPMKHKPGSHIFAVRPNRTTYAKPRSSIPEPHQIPMWR